jgi:hypothetical protein
MDWIGFISSIGSIGWFGLIRKDKCFTLGVGGWRQNKAGVTSLPSRLPALLYRAMPDKTQGRQALGVLR